MANNVLKEYLKNECSQEENYKAIFTKKAHKKSIPRKLLNVAAVVVLILALGVATTSVYAKIQWNIGFKEYQQREVVSGTGAIQEAKDNGFSEEVDMEYVTQDGIGVKIDSLILTDNTLYMELTFKFDEGIDVDAEAFRFSYALYDENANVYEIAEFGENLRTITKSTWGYGNIISYILKDIGADYDKNNMMGVMMRNEGSEGPVSSNAEERTITTSINLTTDESFPQSSKLYMRIFSPSYTIFELEEGEEPEDAYYEYIELSEAEWDLELDVPEKFYERNTVELELEEEIPGFELTKATITETGLQIKCVVEGGFDLTILGYQEEMEELINLTDSEGNKYQNLSMGADEDGNCTITYDVSSEHIEEGIYLNFNNGTQYSSRLVAK